MTSPEQALEQARAAAAEGRREDAYGVATEAAPLDGELTVAKLSEWALIDPDPRLVRSTRRFAAPITALKRGVLRLLYQYHAELLAQQTRFNVAILGRVRHLEERVEALERRQRP